MPRNKIFDYGFLATGLLLQVVTYFIMPHDSIISLVSGLLGICSVCLTAQGNILTFVFGFAQVGTYTYLCLTQRFYGEIGINAYYFATMIYGVYVWRRRLAAGFSSSGGKHTVRTRRMKTGLFLGIAAATVVLSSLTGAGLARWTDDSQPYLDAFTTVPALVAQVLMILVYREHWYIWLAVDVLSTIMWLRAGNYSMAAQYAFWCANCLYGYYRWRRLEATASEADGQLP